MIRPPPVLAASTVGDPSVRDGGTVTPGAVGRESGSQAASALRAISAEIRARRSMGPPIVDVAFWTAHVMRKTIGEPDTPQPSRSMPSQGVRGVSDRASRSKREAYCRRDGTP